MTITIPPELESRLKHAASQRGVEADRFAQQLIEQGLSKPRPNQATLDLLAEWDLEEATTDPAEIERRREEAEQFMRSLTRSRVETEGPGARKLWP